MDSNWYNYYHMSNVGDRKIYPQSHIMPNSDQEFPPNYSK